MRRKVQVATAFAALVCCISSVQAQAKGSCSERVQRDDVVRCALEASFITRAAEAGVEAVAGKQRAVSPWLPTNPVLALSGAHRRSAQSDATNWYALLSQEVEIAGQRRARMRAVGSERRAEEQGVAAARREVATQAWRAYFESLAARDALVLSERLEGVFQSIAATAKAAAAQGLIPGLDADLADLGLVRLVQARLAAMRRARMAGAELISLLGLDPASAEPSVEGELVPLANLSDLSVERAFASADQRPELLGAAAARASLDEWADVYRRSRIPNPTLAVFAQRDGFDERVLGGGISVPIPLPHPVGRTYSAQLEEARARARQGGFELEQVRREVRRELATALARFDIAKAERALFTDERLERATAGLQSIAQEIGSGRLAIGSVVVAQQTLVELLRAHVDARLALCVASVELARAASLALDGGAL